VVVVTGKEETELGLDLVGSGLVIYCDFDEDKSVGLRKIIGGV
jgi:hypothetical protein